MPALEQVRGVIRAIQTFMIDFFFAKRVTNVNLKTSTILATRLISNAWLGPGCASAGWYITVLKIGTKIGKDGK